MRSSLPYLVALLIMAPQPAAADDFPVPPASRRNESLGGATTLTPGKNFIRRVYETDEGIDVVADYYQRRLAVDATRDGETVRFKTARGTVQLTPIGKGTRITLILGPR